MVKDYKNIKLELPPAVATQVEEESKEKVNITYSESEEKDHNGTQSINKYSTLNKVDLLPQFDEAQTRKEVDFSKFIKSLNQSKCGKANFRYGEQ